MTPEEELEALMAIEEQYLRDTPIVLTKGSEPGLLKPKITWNGKEIPGSHLPVFPKEEFTEEELDEWGITDYIVWGT